MIVIRNTSPPVTVKDCFDRHGTAAFTAVELEKPPVTSVVRIDLKNSLERDSEGRIAVQLVERAFLKATISGKVTIQPLA